MYSYYGYGFNGTATLVCAILAVLGGIFLYFYFVKKDDELNNEFLTKLRDFLNFKTMWIEGILKVTYVILALYVTLYSFVLISESFFLFLLVLVLGNVIVRLAYEGSLIILMIWRNTRDINNKLGGAKVEEVEVIDEPKEEKTTVKKTTKKTTKKSAE